jgi:hypothetical protein
MVAHRFRLQECYEMIALFQAIYSGYLQARRLFVSQLTVQDGSALTISGSTSVIGDRSW